MSRHTILSMISIAVAVLATATFAGCYRNTAFFQYHATDAAGWHSSDFLEYHVPAVQQPGYYVEEIGIRTDAGFPYRQISLVVNQNVIHTATKQMGRFRSDTILVDILDEQGRPIGHGTSLMQRVIPFKSLKLETGDSLSLRIRHNMSGSVVKGVTDVGLKVTFQYGD